MSNTELVESAIQRGWITVLPVRDRRRRYGTHEEAAEARRVQRRDFFRAKRARARIGRPIVPNLIPINREMWPPGPDGTRLWRRTYQRLWYHARRAT